MRLTVLLFSISSWNKQLESISRAFTVRVAGFLLMTWSYELSYRFLAIHPCTPAGVRRGTAVRVRVRGDCSPLRPAANRRL